MLNYNDYYKLNLIKKEKMNHLLSELYVFGGAFNPPTNIHINIIQYLSKNYPSDTIVVLPTNTEYSIHYKQHSMVYDNEFRYNLLSEEFKSYENVIIEDIDFRTETSYTYENCKLLQKEYNNKPINIVIGADEVLFLPKWYKYADLLNEFEFTVFLREHYDLNNSELYKQCKNKMNVINIKQDTNISSTIAREYIERNDWKNLKKILPNHIYETIFFKSYDERNRK